MNDNVSQFSMSYNKFLLHLCFKSKDRGIDTSRQISLAEVSFTNVQGNHGNHTPDETHLCHQDEPAGEPEGKNPLQ